MPTHMLVIIMNADKAVRIRILYGLGMLSRVSTIDLFFGNRHGRGRVHRQI